MCSAAAAQGRPSDPSHPALPPSLPPLLPRSHFATTRPSLKAARWPISMRPRRSMRSFQIASLGASSTCAPATTCFNHGTCLLPLSCLRVARRSTHSTVVRTRLDTTIPADICSLGQWVRFSRLAAPLRSGDSRPHDTSTLLALEFFRSASASPPNQMCTSGYVTG